MTASEDLNFFSATPDSNFPFARLQQQFRDTLLAYQQACHEAGAEWVNVDYYVEQLLGRVERSLVEIRRLDHESWMDMIETAPNRMKFGPGVDEFTVAMVDAAVEGLKADLVAMLKAQIQFST